MKEITITIPDNCELKQEGNTYTIVEKEKKAIIYEDVARELFHNKKSGCYITTRGNILDNDLFSSTYYEDTTKCTSEKQAKKLLAINKLMNVAKYLNGNWQPDWNDEKEDKYFITYNYAINEIQIEVDLVFQNSYIYFKSEELAEQAIEILGEETIELALCTDY